MNEENEEYGSQYEDEYQKDINLMEELFENDEKRAQRLLAQFDNHASPVNCVRWNNIGTLFASASDDGSIILWEYRGEKILSAFERQQNSSNNEDKKKDFFTK